MATTSIDTPRRDKHFFRPLLLLLAGAGGLLVIGVIVALLAARQPEATFSPGSPEGTVTTYLRLLQNGQVDEAYAMTSIDMGPPFFEKMTRERFHQEFDVWGQSPHRVTLLRSTNTSGDKASVTVEISTFRPDLFPAADLTVQQTFTLSQREGGGWLITGPAYMG